VFQVGDWQALRDGRTQGASTYGASDFEKRTLVAGKAAHYSLLYLLPALLHGPGAMLGGAIGYLFTQVRGRGATAASEAQGAPGSGVGPVCSCVCALVCVWGGRARPAASGT
jgi:hypothetical protein